MLSGIYQVVWHRKTTDTDIYTLRGSASREAILIVYHTPYIYKLNRDAFDKLRQYCCTFELNYIVPTTGQAMCFESRGWNSMWAHVFPLRWGCCGLMERLWLWYHIIIHQYMSLGATMGYHGDLALRNVLVSERTYPPRRLADWVHRRINGLRTNRLLASSFAECDPDAWFEHSRLDMLGPTEIAIIDFDRVHTGCVRHDIENLHTELKYLRGQGGSCSECRAMGRSFFQFLSVVAKTCRGQCGC